MQVIIRDIVSKSVVAQFRAHKRPIASLCFDPTGMLLVTASIQGHNINVFRIMPSPLGSSSGYDVAGSYVHLYRLQRGLTNAVGTLLISFFFFLNVYGVNFSLDLDTELFMRVRVGFR